MATIRVVDDSTRDRVLGALKKHPGENAWAIQDLMVWPHKTKLHYLEESLRGPRLEYLLETGHPGAQKTKTILLRAEGASAEVLLSQCAPPSPWLLRESPASILPAVLKRFPDVKHYEELRMEVTRSSFTLPAPKCEVRRIVEADAPAFAAFNGAPPAASNGFLEWIRGAYIMGGWVGKELVAMASTFVRVPEVAELIGVKTGPNHTGRGYGTTVTGALTDLVLQTSSVVTLTVMKDNAAAIHMYSKLGYRKCEARVWIDNETGVSPRF